MACVVEGRFMGPPPTYDDYLREVCTLVEGTITIDALPVEMITHIMQYLSVGDRKDAALVCQKWYHASMDPKIQKNMIVAVKSSVTHPRPFTGLQNRTGFHLALSDIDGSSNSLALLKTCELNLSPKLLTLSLKGTSISPDILTTILNKCTNLTSLDISCCNQLLLSGYNLPSSLQGITLPNLLHLDISSVRHLTDASLCAFLAIAPNLQSLNLSYAPFLFSSSYLCATPYSRPNSAALTFSRFLQEVGSRSSSSLTSLNLSRTSISSGALEALAKVPNLWLKCVTLASCKDISDAGVAALCTAQPGIEELDLSSNSQLTAVSIKHIAANLVDLRRLNITKIKLQNKDTKLLQQFSACSKLVLSASILQMLTVDEANAMFSKWYRTLQSLDMSYCAGLSNPVIISMCQYMRNLQELDLSSCFRLDDVSVREISKCLTNLTRLSLAWCKSITDMGLIGVYHEGFAHTCRAECRCSKEKDPSYFEYTPPVRDIAPRVTIPTIEQVNTAIVHHGEEGRFPLWRMTNLRYLDLSMCSKISDVSVIDAIHFPRLATLNLALCSRLTDRAVMSIAATNPLLESVNLSQCSEITDQSIRALLGSCRRLVHLNISNCPLITNRSIDAMLMLRVPLKSLDVSMCNISLEAIEKLEHLAPSLQTIHKRYTSANY